MLISCKISNSVLMYLDHEGCDPAPLLEEMSVPEDFLRDTSYWLAAEEMEDFLVRAERLYQTTTQTDLVEKMAHSVPDLRAWGLLDSVLRMMPKPQDILSQPQRFLSYFISPQPPIQNLKKSDRQLEFDLPLTTDQYPMLTSYLKSSFETLPVFSGQPQARCEWSGIHFAIVWSAEQKSMFKEVDVGHQISPELLRSVVATLEQTQRDLSNLRSQTADANSVELKKDEDFEGIREHLRQSILKLSDYMVRAQQLVTLLIAQNRMSPAVKEAMRRVDWDRVIHQYPQTIRLCQKLLTEPREKLTLTDFVYQEPAQEPNLNSKTDHIEQEKVSLFTPVLASAPSKRNASPQGFHQQEIFRVENN